MLRLLCSALVLTLRVSGPATAPTPIEGRWDLVLETPEGPRPSWLEVRHSGSAALVGQYVGTGGSARPISRVEWDSGTIRFRIPPQWERETNDMLFAGQLRDGRLTGTITQPNGRVVPFAGVRAPTLRRTRPPRWGTPITLFNGRGRGEWVAIEGTDRWSAVDDVLRNVASGANLRTTRTFDDFKLHVEVRFPRGGNSGVYLRGRYEVQIEDSPGPEPVVDGLSSIYGFLAPNLYVNRGADTWHVLDITLIGRLVTVVVDGTAVITAQEIPGITGGALDSNEGAPGPIFLQGDHGPVEYRNIVITPAER